MTERRYTVPEGGLKAAYSAIGIFVSRAAVERALEAYDRWRSENPRVPTIEERTAMMKEYREQNGFDASHYHRYTAWILEEWQRRMCPAPEPEDTREMTVYDCLDCKKSWKQQLHEPVASCVYCQSANTKAIAIISAAREFDIKLDLPVPERINDLSSAYEVYGRDGSVHNALCEAYRCGQRSMQEGRTASCA